MEVVNAQEKFELSVSTAYQQDNFQWSIAGNAIGTNPNVYSELTWKNLSGPALQVSFQAKVWKAVFIKASLNHSLILKGNANDTDYSEDNRTNPIFEANEQSNKGNTDNYILATGYDFKNKVFSISPYLGYEKSSQLMFLLDENIKELNTSYKAKWSGALLGFKTDAVIKKGFYVQTDLAYHQIKYAAEANWNLIEKFAHPVSFKHTADGFGLEGMLKAGYTIYKSLATYLYVQKSFWNTGAGIDELFYNNGNIAYTKLNQVERKSQNLGLGIKFSF